MNKKIVLTALLILSFQTFSAREVQSNQSHKQASQNAQIQLSDNKQKNNQETHSVKPQLKELGMDPSVLYGQLSNGLTYYIKHNETTKDRAHFYIIQNVGAILEEDSQNGLAHFLEHMAFQGTKNLPGKTIINYFETVGVKFGANINAYTSLDETVYNLDAVPTFRAGIVDTALLTLHDWSSFLLLEDSEIDAERGVIKEEWRTRNKASRRIRKKTLPILFKNSQYAKRDVIGDTSIISNFPYDTLRAYYKKWYRPDLQSVVVVGDINAKEIEEKIIKLFSDIKKPENPAKRIYYNVENNKEPIVAIVTDPEESQSVFRVDYRHDPMPERLKASMQGYSINTIQNLVEQMLNDRLEEIVQEKDSPFVGLGVYFGRMVRTKDVFEVYGIPKDGKEKEAFNRLLLEIERAKRYGFTKGELDRAKADYLSMMDKAYNERDKQENKSIVEECKRNFLYFEPMPGIDWEYNMVNQFLPFIELEDVNRILGTFFGKENITLEITGKENLKSIFTESQALDLLAGMNQLTVAPYQDNAIDEPLVKNTPKAGIISKTVFNKEIGFTEWQLSNGMKVILNKRNFKNDEILLYAFSNGGRSIDTNPNKRYSIQVCDDIVESNGLGSFNANALKKALAGKNVAISPSINLYTHNLSGSCSVKDFRTLMQLCHLYFTGVRQDEDGYNAVIAQLQTYLSNRSNNPNAVYNDSILANIYGHHEMTKPLDTLGLKKINQKDALAFFKKCFNNPADFTFVITGNINEDSLKTDILTYLGGIKKKSGKLEWKDVNMRTPKGTHLCNFKQKMETPKASNFLQFSTIMEPTLKNKLQLQVLRAILSNRYLESVREKEGGTYGVNVWTDITQIPVYQACLQINFDTNIEKKDKLMQIIDAEIWEIIKNGPKEEDLLKAKEIMLKNHKENLEKNNYWHSVITNLYRDGYNYHSGYEDIVKNISKDDVQNMLKKFFDTDNRIEVVMMPE